MYVFLLSSSIFFDTNSKISTNDYIINQHFLFEYSSIVGLTEKNYANQTNSYNVV